MRVDGLQALAAASDAYEQRLGLVENSGWNRPTPCAEWDVRALTNHVVAGNTMAVRLLAGASAAEAVETLRSDLLGTEPVAAVRTSSQAQAEAFARPGALEGTVHHPMGDFPTTFFLYLRQSDLLMHAWDLAQAVGDETAFDSELVDLLWKETEPLIELMRASGVFGEGASGLLPDDAPTMQKLLDAFGRRG